MGDDFIKFKFDWLEAVAGNPRVCGRTAIMIAKHLNRATGDCFPSHGRLAKLVKKSRRGLQLSIERLVSEGFLSVQTGAGNGETNRYRPILPANHSTHPTCEPECAPTCEPECAPGREPRFAQNPLILEPYEHNPLKRSDASASSSSRRANHLAGAMSAFAGIAEQVWQEREDAANGAQ